MAQDTTIGNCSVDRLRLLVDVWPKVENLVEAVQFQIRANPNRILPLTGLRYHWCNFYEMRFEQHLAVVLKHLSLSGVLIQRFAAGAVSGDVIDALAAELSRGEIEPSPSPEPSQAAIVLALVTSLTKSLECLLTYGSYLNELIEQARGGDDNALLNAIRIDRSVICGTTGTARLSMAILRGDTKFQGAVLRAWSQKVGTRAAMNYRKMRLVVRVLAEAGSSRLSDLELEELFVKSLALYAPGPSARKNLRKFVDSYLREISST